MEVPECRPQSFLGCNSITRRSCPMNTIARFDARPLTISGCEFKSPDSHTRLRAGSPRAHKCRSKRYHPSLSITSLRTIALSQPASHFDAPASSAIIILILAHASLGKHFDTTQERERVCSTSMKIFMRWKTHHLQPYQIHEASAYASTRQRTFNQASIAMS